MTLHHTKSEVKGKCLQLYVSVYSHSRQTKVRGGYVEECFTSEEQIDDPLVLQSSSIQQQFATNLLKHVIFVDISLQCKQTSWIAWSSNWKERHRHVKQGIK